MLKEAKRYLRMQRELGMSAAGGAGAGGVGVAAAAAAVENARVAAAAAADDDDVPPTAARAAAKRVADARKAALEEDAALASVGAPRESLLDFRAAGLPPSLTDVGAGGGAAGAANARVDAATAKARRRLEKERLEELAGPKATGRDALREKRLGIRAEHRAYQAQRDDAMLGGMRELGGSELGGGGGDEFRAALAAKRRAQERRANARGTTADPRVLAARAEAHERAERERMSAFHELVGDAGGEKMTIPRRGG